MFRVPRHHAQQPDTAGSKRVTMQKGFVNATGLKKFSLSSMALMSIEKP